MVIGLGRSTVRRQNEPAPLDIVARDSTYYVQSWLAVRNHRLSFRSIPLACTIIPSDTKASHSKTDFLFFDRTTTRVQHPHAGT